MIDRLKKALRTRAALAEHRRAAGPVPPSPPATPMEVVGRGSVADRRRLVAALADHPDAAFACGPVLAPPTSREAPFTVLAAGWELGHDGTVPTPLAVGAGERVDSSWAPAVTHAARPSGRLVVRRPGASGAGGIVVWSAPTVVDSVAPPAGITDTDVERRRREGFGGTERVDAGPPTAPLPAARWLGAIHRRQQPGVDGDGPPPRVAIRHAATDWSVAGRWGDHHFATAVARAWERRGVGARVVPLHAWSHPYAARDIVITLRGLQPVTPVAQRFNILWVISHPEEVTPTELDGHDLVAVASPTDVERLSAMTSSPVITLLQATDPERFHRAPREHAEGVVFVGNSRGVLRSSIRLAAESAVPVVVHGSGWEGIAPAGVDVREPVANEDVPDVFNRAAVVLADHWDDMARLGYVANRLFDVYAAGGLPLSDPVAGLEAVLPGTPTYDDDLGSVAAHWTAPERRAERRDLVERLQGLVLARHTFDARVDELVSAMETAGAGRLLDGIRAP